MPRGLALKPIQLPTISYSASGTASTSFDFLPKEDFGKPVHVAGITFDIHQSAISITTPATRVGQNNIVKRMELRDGKNQVRFIGGGFNALRAKERLEHGGAWVPEPDKAAAVNHWGRHWAAMPHRMEGFPSDGLIPVALLHGGQIDYTFGALTDYSADLVSTTTVITPIAWCCTLDYVNLPPLYKFEQQAVTGKSYMITAKRALAYLGLLNSSSFDAITAGDFGNISASLAQGDLVRNVPAPALTRMYQALMNSGLIGALQGDPRAATDDNSKIPDSLTPFTALIAQDVDLQVVHAAMPGTRLSKLYEADPCTVSWDGTQSGAELLIGSFLEQTPGVAGAAIDHVFSKLGKARGPIKPKTHKPVTDIRQLGNRPWLYPYKVKFA